MVGYQNYSKHMMNIMLQSNYYHHFLDAMKIRLPIKFKWPTGSLSLPDSSFSFLYNKVNNYGGTQFQFENQ